MSLRERALYVRTFVLVERDPGRWADVAVDDPAAFVWAAAAYLYRAGLRYFP